ncbi:MAG TPA: hypothetical protein VKY85_01345 [Candidatus Angelobacter sp.]|nr:hypothetical protein [Candidatus Angelobacter sp.]
MAETAEITPIQRTIEALHQRQCVCGNKKSLNEPFCGKCYHRLTEPMRRAVNAALRKSNLTALAAAFIEGVAWLEARRSADKKEKPKV